MKQIKEPVPVKQWGIVFLIMVGLIVLLYFGSHNIRFSQSHFVVSPAVYLNELSSSQLYKMKPRSIFTLSEMLRDKNWEIREQAAYALGRIKDYRVVEPLIAALKDKDPGVRWTAVRALGEIGSKKAFEPLLAACTDPDNETTPDIETWVMRERILKEKARAKRFGDTYEGSVFSGVDIQREAVRSLLQIDRKEAKKRLIPLIEKEKRAGVLAAMELNDCSLLGDLLNLLESIGIAESDESRCRIQEIRLTLQRLACPELVNLYLFGKQFEHEEWVIRDVVMGMDRDIVLETALPALRNKDLAICKRALDLADSFWDARVKAELVRLLANNNAGIKVMAMRMLCQREDPSLKNVFINKLKDRNHVVRAYAAQALLRIGDLRAVESIIPTPGQKSYCYDENFMDWLARAGNEKARQIFLNILKKQGMKGCQTYTLCYYAALKLGELKEKRAIPLLSSILHQQNGQEKNAVIVALGQLKYSQAVPAILKELKNSFSNGPNSGYTQYYALQALQNISIPTAAATLAKIYESGPHWQNHSSAIGVLDTFDKCFSDALINVLQKQLQNPIPSIRSRVVEILSHSRNKKALAALKPVLSDSDWRTRKAALDSLWANASLTEKELSQFILNEPHWPTRFSAIVLLRQFHVEPAEIAAFLCKRNEPFLIRQQLFRLQDIKKENVNDDLSIHPLRLPSVIITSEKGISQMDYDGIGNEYKVNRFFKYAGYTHIFHSENSFFVINDHAITRLDQKFHPSKPVDLGNIGACISNRKLQYVSADGYFLILDENLSVLSKLSLGIFSDYLGKMKNAHDIVVHGNTAYLLDNISHPVFILRIDVSDPRQPKCIQETEIEYVNHHLDAQWIAPAQNEWRIIQSSSHMGGSFQWLLKFSLISGKLKDRVLLFRDFEKTDPWIRIDGWVEAIDPQSPEWMVIRKDSEYFLGRLSMETGELLKQGLLPLGMRSDLEQDGEGRWVIKHEENLLYIIRDFHLWVIRSGEKPEILVYQKFGEKILDMVFHNSRLD